MIGNLLSTRKYEVVFVDRTGEKWIRLPSHGNEKEGGAAAATGQHPIVEGEGDEIESIIIPECVKRHQELMMRRSVERVGRGINNTYIGSRN